MLSFNFYKVRTGIDIRPITQGGDPESHARLDQIIQTISQKAEIEFTAERVFETIEKNPADLGAYASKQLTIYVFIFGVDKTRSAWTAADLKTTFGNMVLTQQVMNANESAQLWVEGAKNNISCEAALFDLRSKKKKK